MAFSFKKITELAKNLILPKVNIAGLEIKEGSVRIAKLEDGKLKQAAIVLNPGIIENGKVSDSRKLAENLKSLHLQFAKPNEKISVVVLIPSVNVYTQVFNLPTLSKESLEEAAKLNLQSISPIDWNASYADWQKIGEQEKDGKVELLGAFSAKTAIDEYVKAISAAGFIPVAIEFPALAIARTIKELAAGIDLEKPQVVLNVGSDGINFMVLRSGNLYFDYFTPWKLIQEESHVSREILFADFQDTIVREIKKVATFYGSRSDGKLEKLILITQALQKEISDLIQENFHFEVAELKLREFPDLPPSWFGVLGGAIRGRLSRAEDNLISLAAIGTEKGYFQEEILNFIKVWRNACITSLGFLVLIFILADSFLARNSVNLEKQLQTVAKAPEGAEVLQLQKNVQSFNQLMDKALVAKGKSAPWSPFFSKINSLIGSKISLTRIFVDTERNSALISGNTDDQSTVVNFKNSLIQEGFKSVSLPLSNIIINTDKTVSFTITFSL